MIGWREGTIVSDGGQTWRHSPLPGTSCLAPSFRPCRTKVSFLRSTRMASAGPTAQFWSQLKPRYLWDGNTRRDVTKKLRLTYYDANNI